MVLFRILKRKIGQKLYKIRTLAFSDKYLLLTNLSISVSLSSVGDAMEQHREIIMKELEKYNSKRTLQMGLSGMTVGVVCHYWYKYLDKRLVGRSFSIIFKKVLLDQIVCSPLYIAAFFVTLAILEEASIEELKNEFRDKFLKLYLAEWIIWPPAQIINFYFLPTKYRVLYDNSISLCCDVYFSGIKHSKN